MCGKLVATCSAHVEEMMAVPEAARPNTTRVTRLEAVRITHMPLRTLTTLGVGGDAEVWELRDPERLRVALEQATAAPYRVLGAGSNILAADAGVLERIIKFGRAFNSLPVLDAALARGDKQVWLSAATPLPGIVRRTASVGVSGFAGLLGVPAVLGGAIAMNAGTRFGAMSDVVNQVEIFVDGKLERLPASDLDFAYRHTNLPAGAIITAAEVRLTAASVAAVQATLTQVDAARRGQPKVKSAGCAFKNPPQDSAGKLIDEAGLKGLRVGGAMIAFEHGNFIVNLGTATARDICTLLERVRARLPELEPEWRMWGVPSAEGEDATCAA